MTTPDTRPRVYLSPADCERVAAMAKAERRSMANMLGVLVAEALAARDADRIDRQLAGFQRAQARAQKGATR